MYGNAKYGSPDNWKQVEIERYLDDPHGVDAESGLPHLWHLCCNCAFLCEMEDIDDNPSGIRRPNETDIHEG